jgi:hypothetical protein
MIVDWIRSAKLYPNLKRKIRNVKIKLKNALRCEMNCLANII